MALLHYQYCSMIFYGFFVLCNKSCYSYGDVDSATVQELENLLRFKNVFFLNKLFPVNCVNIARWLIFAKKNKNGRCWCIIIVLFIAQEEKCLKVKLKCRYLPTVSPSFLRYNQRIMTVCVYILQMCSESLLLSIRLY